MADRPTQVIVKVEGQDIPALARTFTSGSEGFFASGAPVIAGEKYQLTMSLVRHGSKPQPEGATMKGNGPAVRTRS